MQVLRFLLIQEILARNNSIKLMFTPYPNPNCCSDLLDPYICSESRCDDLFFFGPWVSTHLPTYIPTCEVSTTFNFSPISVIFGKIIFLVLHYGLWRPHTPSDPLNHAPEIFPLGVDPLVLRKVLDDLHAWKDSK